MKPLTDNQKQIHKQLQDLVATNSDNEETYTALESARVEFLNKLENMKKRNLKTPDPIDEPKPQPDPEPLPPDPTHPKP